MQYSAIIDVLNKKNIFLIYSKNHQKWWAHTVYKKLKLNKCTFIYNI